MVWTNYHQHCHYCDGKKSVEEHVHGALEQGIVSIGFSCHCPVPFENTWSMKQKDISSYLQEIEQAKEKFSDQIQIYRSLEIDYIPGIIHIDDPWIKALDLDYTLGSVHFVGGYLDGRPWEIDGSHSHFMDGLEKIYQGDVIFVVKKNFDLIRQMVRSSCPDIIGHLDKIKMQNRGLWDENDVWYRNEILQTLEEIKAAGAIVEVNTRGLYKKLTTEPYPGQWILEQILQMDIPIQINSDAHHPREITNNFSEVAQLLKSIGFNELHMFHNHQWQSVPFDAEGLIIN